MHVGNSHPLIEVTRSTTASRSASLLVLCFLLSFAVAAGAEKPSEYGERMISPSTRELGIAPAEKVFVRGAEDAGLASSLTLPQATVEAPGGALSIQPDPIPASDVLTVRGRLRADEAGGAVGIGLAAESSGAWVVAGILPSAEGWRLALWRSGIERADIASTGSWTPAPGDWFMLEVEYSSSRGTGTWKVRAWPARGERPSSASLTVEDPTAGDATFHPAFWASGTGTKRAASLESYAVSKNSADGAEEAEDWALTVEDGDLVVRSGGEVVHRLSLADDEPDFASGAGTRGARVLTKSGSTCDGYRYRFSGVARGYPGSSATLLLPPRDNDCDGEFNEDPINGHDDDGDGLIDEDPVWGPDRVLNWRSSDPEIGEFETGDLPAAFLLIRRCFPRPKLTMAFAAVHNWSDPTWLAGWAQVSPYGSGRAGLAHHHDKVTYKLQPAPPELQVTILESGEPLADLSWFSRPVVLDAHSEGGVGEVTISLNLDGQPIQPGEVVSEENTYRVTAEADRFHRCGCADRADLQHRHHAAGARDHRSGRRVSDSRRHDHRDRHRGRGQPRRAVGQRSLRHRQRWRVHGARGADRRRRDHPYRVCTRPGWARRRDLDHGAARIAGSTGGDDDFAGPCRRRLFRGRVDLDLRRSLVEFQARDWHRRRACAAGALRADRATAPAPRLFPV